MFRRSVVAQAAATDPVIARRVAEAAAALARPLRRDVDRGFGPAGKLADWASGAVLLAAADDATMRAAALWIHQRACSEGWRAPAHVTRLGGMLARRKLSWTTEEADWAFRVLRAGTPDAHSATFTVPFAAAGALPAAALDVLRPHLEWALEELRCDNSMDNADLSRFLPRVRAMLGDTSSGGSDLPPAILHAGDHYGPAIRSELAAELAAPGVAALLVHCASASGRVLPTAAWSARASPLLAAASGGTAVLRSLLDRLGSLPERSEVQRYGDDTETTWHWLHPDTESLLRGALWVVGALDEPWVDALLGDVALRAGTGFGGSGGSARSARLCSTAVALISRRDGPDAARILTGVHGKVEHRALRKGITAALDAVAERAGVPRSQLLEQAVADFGLDAEGRLHRRLGDHIAVIALTSPGAVQLTFRTAAGRVLASVPAAVRTHHKEELAALRRTVKELRTALSAQRNRLEDLLATERVWPHRDWARYYRDHPVVGVLVRSLIWELELTAGQWTAGWPHGDGFVDVHDAPVAVPAGDTPIRLWHPMAAGSEQTRRWRHFVTERELRQPFKQAFREVYVLTPAERSTATYSNRFAAHVLRAQQAGALLRTRGWHSPHLGYWDGGFDGHATKEIGDGGWHAEFYFDGIDSFDDDNGYLVSLAGSDQVKFRQGNGRGAAATELHQVPPRVFSEAMRDVDLVIGVASIAGDPAWVDRGEERHRAYWNAMSFGGLGPSAEVRREALARLIPRTAIADRCVVGERFLVVRGRLTTYKIHIGSGNILMEPDDRYLCIVAARDATSRLYLPFEEDGGRLSLIVSKAFLLAADDTITDRSILRQIRSTGRW